MSEETPTELLAYWERFGGKNVLNVPFSELNDVLEKRFLDNLDDILSPTPLCQGCMDEGVGNKAVGLGGPGIVLSYFSGKALGKGGWQAVQAGMETVAEVLKNEVTEITSHSGCGASAIIYNFLHEDEKESFKTTDDVAISFAKELAATLNINYRHIGWDEMKRPITGHPARIVSYTGTRYLNVDSCLPQAFSFTISRGLLEKIKDKAFASIIGKLLLETACTIATGDHGLGKLATPETPFIILPIGGSMLSLDKVKTEADEIAGKFGGRVVVLEGFTL